MNDKDKTLLQQLAETAKQLPPHGFQSTHPVGGATQVHKVSREPKVNFNPRTPWGVRHRCTR